MNNQLPSSARALPALLVGLILATTANSQDEEYWAAARKWMVQREVFEAGVKDARVCEALRRTPRHLFVPPSQRKNAYYDVALPIGEGQTISPPFIVAYMTEQLDPQPKDKVLEIGTGSGYQAAVLSHLVAEVYSIEIVEALGRKAAATLRELKYQNVKTKIGDGFQGWAEHAPFDKIIVTCSPEKIPKPLVDQLREGGHIVIPLGERYHQTLNRFTKVNGKLKRELLQGTYFVPMTGRAEDLREVNSDSGRPNLVNGGFEAETSKGEPTGWYYVRQAKVHADPKSPQGKSYLRCANTVHGRGSQALQALGLDGRKVKKLNVSIWVRTTNARPGLSLSQSPRVEIVFYDENRAPVGSSQLGPWFGTADWAEKRSSFNVPADARIAVLIVGMFGGIGEIGFDRITIQPADQDMPDEENP